MNYALLAEKHAATAFLNSLFKEWPRAELRATPPALGAAAVYPQSLHLTLPEARSLWLPLESYSLLGRHRYALPFFVEEAGTFRASRFADLRTLIAGPLAAHFGGTEAADFEGRVQESQRIIEETLRERAPAFRALHELPSFLAGEQGLALGHSFHPTPKSREGFSEADLKAYSPELGGAFRLAWYLVKEEALLEEKGSNLKNRDWLLDLFRAEVGEEEARAQTAGGWRPLPVHPWQRDKTAQLPAIGAYRERGLLRDHAGGDALWYPTSSLRTIYRDGAPYMLKFSLSVRLTNSVRHITAAELRRGLQVHEVFLSPPAKALAEEFPHFHVIAEPAFAALRGEAGAPLVESIVVARENPFHAVNPALVVATLAQEAPLGGESLILTQAALAGDPTAWFRRFLELTVAPFIVAEGELGIILGAHQQNLLLACENGWPKEAYFRDCHGTGYTAAGVERFLPHVPLLGENNGNLVPERMGHVLFAYYLILNTVFNVISALSTEGGATEAELITSLRSFLAGMRERPRMNPAFLNYLLESPELLHKGNFYCAWSSLNENTTADPLALYTKIPNPLYRGNA